MSSQLVHFPAVLPIPVGHEVEVRIYAFEEGLFTKNWVVRAGDAAILDRTTGVLYGSDWHFAEVNMYRSGEVVPQIPMTVRQDLRLHSVVAGRVSACRVVWIGSGDSRFPQTTLAITTNAVGVG